MNFKRSCDNCLASGNQRLQSDCLQQVISTMTIPDHSNRYLDQLARLEYSIFTMVSPNSVLGSKQNSLSNKNSAKSNQTVSIIGEIFGEAAVA